MMKQRSEKWERGEEKIVRKRDNQMGEKPYYCERGRETLLLCVRDIYGN